MNKIKVTVDKITAPLITEDELNLIDNNLHSIIEDFLKCKVHDKDLYLSQYIIKKLEEENQELKKQLKATEEVVEEHMKKWVAMEAKQEKFVKYLEDMINWTKEKAHVKDVYSDNYTETGKQSWWLVQDRKEILSKYKEIIGKE